MLSALQARIRIVQSPSNPRVKALRRAVEHPPSLHRYDPSTLIAAEGFHLLTEALRAGLTPQTIFLPQGDEHAALQTLLRGLIPQDAAGVPEPLAHAELLALPPALLRTLLDTVTPQHIAALLHPPAPALFTTAGAPLVLVLCGLQDPGNTGTLLRSAYAFGASAALLLTGTATPWSGKCLRASAGAAFHLPLLSADNAAQAQALLHARGIRSYAAVPRKGAAPPECALHEATALWIGNEGAGLTTQELAACDARITLPMRSGAESLNAAVAGSLLLYEAARSRAASNQP